MLRRLGSRTESQQGDRRISHFRRAVTNGITNIILSLPWFIAYFAVFSKVDSNMCTGTPYDFGAFARWAYLGSTIAEVVLFPVRLRIAKKKDMGEESSLASLGSLLGSLLSSFVFGVWIYACIALSRRSDCLNDSLVSLLWATVLIPAIMMGLMCCCCCCFVVAAGAALGVAANMENKAQNQQTQGTEANQLQRDLEAEKNRIEMQIAENQNIQRVEMA